MHSNLITPPDVSPDPNLPNVLILDVDPETVDTIGLWCQYADQQYNIYIYNDVMLDTLWLDQIIKQANHILLNTERSAISSIKGQLLNDSRTWYWGSDEFRNNPRKLTHPLDFFLEKHV